jgi:three-Cys-motif partner protein
MSNDRSHFKAYREQTRVKHEILEKYLKAYLNILKKWNNTLLFIDGFSGPGSYQDNGSSHPGSPILALKLVAGNNELAQRVTTIFIEKDSDLFSSLEAEAKKFQLQNPTIREPILCNAEFKEAMETILNQLEAAGKTLAPTFLFADPCGVRGVHFATLQRLLKSCKSEIFLFFNMDGLKRILGLAEKQGPTLTEFLGSEDAATDLSKVIQNMSPEDKENAIFAKYTDIVRQKTGANYITSFRIEKEKRRGTSHYLIHITKHPLGFRIMKDVMYSAGTTTSGRKGLALMQKSVQSGYTLLDPEWDEFKESILSYLDEPKRASYFYKDLPEQPDNLFCEPAYREALLELEKEGKIIVLNEEGATTSAKTRRKRQGQPTLSDKHKIQLNTTE